MSKDHDKTSVREGKEKLKELLDKKIQDQLAQDTPAEEKIRLCLEAMALSLSGEGTPHFREFWQVKQLCLPLFKEAISPKMRSLLWAQYIELSTEAKRLKEILDEQSTFASEQIELAIQAIERDLTLKDSLIEQASLEYSFEQIATLKDKSAQYQKLQKHMVVLSLFASRINAMRQEVLNTEMRIRIKNQLLARLSQCGDQVFPTRRALIQELSSLFQADVDQFVQTHFEKTELSHLPIPALKEEIKQLQQVAKELALSTAAFAHVRKQLSTAWDYLKPKAKAPKIIPVEPQTNKWNTFKKKAEELQEKMHTMDQEELKTSYQALLAESKTVEMSIPADLLFKPMQEHLHEKKMAKLLSLPEETEQALGQLKMALSEHESKRQEMKRQIEGYRKLLGGSSLDFEKAMLYREMIETEKVKLEKVEQEIEEIQEKVAELE